MRGRCPLTSTSLSLTNIFIFFLLAALFQMNTILWLGEKLLNVDNLYDINNAAMVHNLDKALVAVFSASVPAIAPSSKFLIALVKSPAL